MIDENVLVSVLCTTFNHEMSIGDALESFLKQNTTFNFEIIVHDDASNDKTVDIIKEYANKYPEIIIPIYQIKNQYSINPENIYRTILSVARGKYFALCEGDDYWSDVNKLQKQYDALEVYKSCKMCVHRVREVSFSKNNLNRFYPNFKIDTGIISPEEFLSMGIKYSFQTSSYFVLKDEFRDFIYNSPLFVVLGNRCDEVIMLYFALKGDIFYINNEMSCYRRGSTSSWSTNMMKESYIEKQILRCKSMLKVYESFNEYSNYVFKKIINKRIAIVKGFIYIMRLDAIKFFSYHDFKYFISLPLLHKCVICAAVISPSIVRDMYTKKVLRENEKFIKENE